MRVTKDDFHKRMKTERRDLGKRLGRLSVFIYSKGFDELPRHQQDLLSRQLDVMQDYYHILTMRLKYLEKEDE